jgi:hypothetical protein
VALGGKHTTQKKQIARLHRFHICPERLRGDGSSMSSLFNRC